MKTMGVIVVGAGVATAFQSPSMVFGGGPKKTASAAQKKVASKVGGAKQKVGGALNKAKSAPAAKPFAKLGGAANKAKQVAAKAAPKGTPLQRNLNKATSAPKQAFQKAASAVKQAPAGDALAFGTDVEAGFWDPIQLAADKPAETLNWYRAAELKHGRVAMLAALGTFVQAAGIHLPDSTFDAPGRSFEALSKVASERPGAIGQIVLAIAAVEVLTLQLQDGAFPGDLGFDPANQIPTYERQGKFDELRLKELKNGRLAMVGIIGMWVQEYLTGQGVFEQLTTGHISPVNDGQGYF